MSERDKRLAVRSAFQSSRASDMVDRLRQASRSRVKPAETPAEESAVERRRTPSDYLSVKGELQARLLDDLAERDMLGVDEQRMTELVQDFVGRVLEVEDLPLNAAERTRISGDLVEETIGLGPLAPLMADAAVTDILVNGPNQVYVERFGKLELTNVRFRDDDHVVRVIERIAARVGRRIDRGSPTVDLRLADGSRVNATLPPVSIDYPTLSIRRFGHRRLRARDLERLGSLSAGMQTFLELVVENRLNVLISGGTGAGKSTLLGALAESIDEAERIVTIEDTAELMLDQAHVVRLETRPPNTEGAGVISTRDLVINALRMRPDRIIVGEVRGGEALDMLQSMNTGHDGSMTTVHANSARDALARLETMVLLTGTELPSRAIREQIVSAIHLVVHVARYEDGVRRVSSISEITGLEGATPLMQDIFVFKRTGRRDGRVLGHFDATGIIPQAMEALRERGVQMPLAVFQSTGETPQ